MRCQPCCAGLQPSYAWLASIPSRCGRESVNEAARNIRGCVPRGSIGPDALAYTIVQLHVCDLKALCNSTIRALAQARGLAPNVTGTIDSINLETTARHEGHGHVTRMQKVTDTRG